MCPPRFEPMLLNVDFEVYAGPALLHPDAWPVGGGIALATAAVALGLVWSARRRAGRPMNLAGWLLPPVAGLVALFLATGHLAPVGPVDPWNRIDLTTLRLIDALFFLRHALAAAGLWWAVGAFRGYRPLRPHLAGLAALAFCGAGVFHGTFAGVWAHAREQLAVAEQAWDFRQTVTTGAVVVALVMAWRGRGRAVWTWSAAALVALLVVSGVWMAARWQRALKVQTGVERALSRPPAVVGEPLSRQPYPLFPADGAVIEARYLERISPAPAGG